MLKKRRYGMLLNFCGSKKAPAEGLNVTIKAAVSCGYFNGVKIGSSSHLQYAYDTLIFGEWKESNARNLMRIMECVKQASGLKINSNKTKVYGIRVQNGEIEDFANLMGISPGKMPFTYLGIPIGVNMKIVDSWKIIVEKFKKRLGNWKTNMISFCGRLTLVKSVLGSLALYFFSLFRAPMSVLKNLEKPDSWRWIHDDDGIFSVKRLREMIDDKILNKTNYLSGVNVADEVQLLFGSAVIEGAGCSKQANGAGKGAVAERQTTSLVSKAQEPVTSV
nr:protein kinase-like domain, beta-lactamase/transpeptidase-like protein [Tanacetum cinerariifolium]